MNCLCNSTNYQEENKKYFEEYLKPENVERRKKESKKWDLEIFKKLKAKEGGIFGCYLDPRLLEHLQGKIKLPIGTWVMLF